MKILENISTGTLLRTVFMLAIALCALIPFASAEAALPDGFTDEVVVGGLTLPTTFDFAPDGRMFVAEKNGTVRIIKNGQLLSQPFYTIPTINTWLDRGLIGLAIDPNFDQNGWVYLSYTYDNNPADEEAPKMARIIRVKAVGDVADPNSVEILIGTEVGDAILSSCNDFPAGTDCIPSDSGSHSAGGLRFGPDGYLYATLGDGAGFSSVDPNAYKAQDLDWLTGKILRLNTDGTAPSDNPFFTGDPTANRSKVYAYGIRNSFRFDFRQTNGSLYTGEVGWGAAEEINVVHAGDNLGWPCREGYYQQGDYVCEAVDYVDPMYSYSPNPGSVAVTGGAFAGDAYPEEYQDTYFFGDFHLSSLFHMVVDENDEMVSLDTWHDGTGNGPVSILRGPDGSIYYVAIFTGQIRQLVHESMRNEQHPPAANDDTVEALKNTPISIEVTKNDTDINLDPLTVTAVSSSTHGVTEIIDATHVQYTPAIDYVGTDSFSYEITDGFATSSAVVTVTIKEGGDSSVVVLEHIGTIRSSNIPVVGEIVTLSTKARNTGEAGPILIDFELHNVDTGTRVKQVIYDNEPLPVGVDSTFSFNWLPDKSGTYRLDVGYFYADWQQMHQWVHGAMTFSVYDREPPADPFDLELDGITVSATTIEVGETLDIAVDVTNTGRSGKGLIDIEVYDENTTTVGQEVFNKVSFADYSTSTFTMQWTPTATGTYYVDAGAFGPDWAPFMDWLWRTVEVTVIESTTPTTPFELTVDAVHTNVSTVTEGDPIEITATVTNTGLAGTGIVDIELTSANPARAGEVIGQFVFDNEAFAAGETKQLTGTWIANETTTDENIWVDVGLFSTGWESMFEWAWHADSFIVTDTSATGSAIMVYTDVLNANWQDWSWDTTVNAAYSATTVDGTAIEITHNSGWAGFNLHAITPLNIAGVTALSFDIAGLDTDGQLLQIILVDQNDAHVIEQQLNPLTANEETVSVDLSTVAADTHISAIIIQDRSGNPGTHYTIDTIRFE